MSSGQIIFGRSATRPSADRARTYRQIGRTTVLTCWIGVLGSVRGSVAGAQLAGEDEPLAAVDQFAGRVQVAGVSGGLGDHVQDRVAQRPGREVAEEVGPPLRH